MGKVVQKKLRHSGDGLNIAADVNAVVATNSGGGAAASSRRQSVRIMQKNGHTEVTEETEEN